jgi:Holliday junction resolvasome RuvABC endonuclease subunit
MKILGIDPSLTGCGLALIKDGKLVTAITVGTRADAPRGQRLATIVNVFEKFYFDHRPDVIAMEGYSFGSQFNREEMGEVGGVLKQSAYILTNRDLIIWPNQSWKKAVLGKGSIKKEDVKLPVYQRYGVEVPDMNQVEAFCVAMAEHLAQSNSALRPIPKPKRKARRA